MRIAYVVDTFPKRSETFVRDEVEWMERHGLLDRVFAIDSETEALDEISEAVRAKIRLLRMPRRAWERYGPRSRLRWYRRRPALLRSRLRARSLSRESYPWFVLGHALARLLGDGEMPSAMHVHFAGLSAQIARYASHVTGVPFTFCAHHYDIFHSAPPNLPVLAHDAAQVTTISAYNRRYLIHHHGLSANKIRIVHCGIDTQRFDRVSAVHGAHDTSGAARLNLVSVGRLTAIKAHRHQIEAARLLADRGIDFRLRIIGDGDQRAALSEQIEVLGLSEQVLLLGAQPSGIVRSTLQQSDLFIMSSLSEGIPVALMEALATRVPVVTTGVRGIPELVNHEVNGLIVPERDPQALADAILELADDPERRALMGESGRHTVIESFNADTEYRKLVDIWQHITA